MQAFLALPRFLFTRPVVEYSPEESGIFGLFDAKELIFIGRAVSIKDSLLAHQDGQHGDCTTKATAYTWEITDSLTARQIEVLSTFRQQNGCHPRCQGKPGQT